MFGSTYLCELLVSLMTGKYLRNIRMEGYQFVIIIEINKNTNVESEIIKISTNKKCQSHKNICTEMRQQNRAEWLIIL